MHRHLPGWGFLLALFVLAAARSVEAQAAEDFDVTHEGWNSLTRFVALARAQRVPFDVVQRLDVGTLNPEDALILIGPSEALPSSELTAFLRAGGRIALADDFGHGDSLLQTFRIGRGAPNRSAALSLRGNEELLIARPITGHPLTRGVTALLTNHPQVVYHAELEPIFAFGEHDAVVLAGAVNAGRLVAIGDPSIFIDNMLELAGNRRFVENLFHYLGSAAGGRILLVPPSGTVVGRFGEPGADRPLHDVRVLLERIAEADLPPNALRVGAASLAGLLLFLAAGLLPRASPYARDALFGRPGLEGGFAGRVAWFAKRPGNLAEPMVVYQQEFELELGRILGLPRRARIDDVTTRMKAHPMSAEDVSRATSLWRELESVREEMERGSTGDALPEARFRRLVEGGDALLASLRSPR